MAWTRFAILMLQELASARLNSRAVIARSANSKWSLNASPAAGPSGAWYSPGCAASARPYC
jgi:hypothetical protein